MKKSSLRQTLWLCLPVLLIVVVGGLISGWREHERKAQLAYYSQPYRPQLKVERAEVPKVGEVGLGLFEVRARCLSTGGSHHAQWLVRGQLFDVSGPVPREIWNSQKPPLSVSFLSSYSGSFQPLGDTPWANFHWRFSHDPKDKRTLKFVVEAVANPISVPASQFGSGQLSVQEAKPFQIALAKQQPNARYFRESLVLKPSDDAKYQTQ